MFTTSKLLYAYYGVVGIKNVYNNIKNEIDKNILSDDTLINSVINDNKKIIDKSKKKYSIKKIKVNRKIPDKDELDNIFKDFINNNKNIKIKDKLDNDIIYEKLIKNVNILNNNYFMYNFTLRSNIFYKLLVNIELENINNDLKILFLITNQFKDLKYEFNIKNNNNLSIILTNISFNNNQDINIYLIFKHFNRNLLIKNINLSIEKVNNKTNNYPILIIKNNIYKQYLFKDKNIFNIFDNLLIF